MKDPSRSQEAAVVQPLIIRLIDEEWDLTVCERLKQLLAPALDHPNVIVDMSAVHYMDSSCLNQLVRMYNERVTKRGFSPARVAISAPNIQRLFSIVNLDRLWRIFGTLEEACKDAAIGDDRTPQGSS